MERDYTDYLQDILDSINKIGTFIHNLNFYEFKSDEKTIYVVIRALEILGEATKNIPDKIRNENPKVPWREMSGMRDKLIHDYFGVNHEVIWKTVKNDLPALQPLIENILNKMK